MLLDASIGNTMMAKDIEEAIVIIESLTTNDHQVQYDRQQPSKRGILDLGTHDLGAQNKLI